MARLAKATKRVAEDALAGEAGDDFADHAHAGQDHDVDGRVGVEPEQVLEQQRIAAEAGIEDADAAGRVRGRPAARVMASTGVPGP